MGPGGSAVPPRNRAGAGWRLIATALGWIAAVIASLPIAASAVAIALLAGASGPQIAGNGRVGVAVVIFGGQLPAGVIAAGTIPAAWRRIVGQTTTFRRAFALTLPTMGAVAALEAVKARLPAPAYVAVSVLQLTLALAPLTVRGLPGSGPPTAGG